MQALKQLQQMRQKNYTYSFIYCVKLFNLKYTYVAKVYTPVLQITGVTLLYTNNS